MTLAELVASGLAKIQTGMPADIAGALLALVEAETAKEGAEPLPAFGAALAAFRSQYERKGDTWAKRDSAVTTTMRAATSMPFTAWNYNVLELTSGGPGSFCCRSCLRAQTDFACSACAAPGPGGYCYACGACLAYSCPKCMAPWAPVQVGAESGSMRMMVAEVTEVRSAKGVGSFRLIVNSSKKDDWGTVISTRGVAKKIKPGVTAVDIDHQICKHGRASRTGCPEHDGFITGARITSVTEAIVPFRADPKTKPENVDAVIIDVECDLSEPRADLLYQGVRSSKYTDGSILFTYPKAVNAALQAGRTDQIHEDEVLTVPAITLTRKGSNPVAWVTEIRTSRELSTPVQGEPETPPTTEEPKPEAKPAPEADPLASFRTAVGVAGGGAGLIPPASKPAAPSAPGAVPPTEPGQQAGVAPEVLTAALETLKVVQSEVTAIRTAAPETEAKVVSMGAELSTLRVSLQAANDTVTAMRTQNEAQAAQIVKLTELVKETIAVAEAGYTSLRQDLNDCTVRPGRKGTSGAENSTESMRTTAAGKTPEEIRHEAQVKRTLRLKRLEQGLL